MAASPGCCDEIDRLLDALTSPPAGLHACRSLLDQVRRPPGAADGLGSASDAEVEWWAHAFKKQCDELLDDLDYFAPWASCRLRPISSGSDGSGEAAVSDSLGDGIRRLDEAPTLRETADFGEMLMPALDGALANLMADHTRPAREWLDRLRHAVSEASGHAADRLEAIERLGPLC